MSPDAWGGVLVAFYGLLCLGIPMFFACQIEQEDRRHEQGLERIRRAPSPPRSTPPRPRTARQREEFTRDRLRLAEEVLLARGNPHAVRLAEEIRRGRERRERTWTEEGR